MKINFMVTKDMRNRPFCAATSNFIGKEISVKNDSGEETKIVLLTKEDNDKEDFSGLTHYYGDNTAIYSIEMEDVLLGSHEVDIERRLVVIKGNKTVREVERYDAVLCDVAISSWTFSHEKSEPGFLSMPSEIGKAISRAVGEQLFGFDAPNS